MVLRAAFNMYTCVYISILMYYYCIIQSLIQMVFILHFVQLITK